MASHFDDSDFVDGDYYNAKSSSAATMTHSSGVASPGMSNRPPSREELDTRVTEAQQRLEQLRQAQEELQRERAALEETRRRRVEFQTGREEMLQHLTRGVGLLEEAEFNARRDAEQMARSLAELRESLTKVQAIREEGWTQDNFNTELTRALTTIENARLEWNSARLKWSVLNGSPSDEPVSPVGALTSKRDFRELCKLGLALNWPVAVVGLVGFLIMLLLLLRR